ncbi:Vacuolar protein sorting-associated protein 51 -like protein [Trichinella pseudospiralis]|uniref:Vacuolar protein sorting-associated protein 51 homolog n=1 Tax=Trichinella pseudospiralis TaxID=6337 RepID=A0A0V1FTN8_TRIPS|nr:Vacuolar protein sorting-associated protein 51 -like protein [Trichinella pseudospiralis]
MVITSANNNQQFFPYVTIERQLRLASDEDFAIQCQPFWFTRKGKKYVLSVQFMRLLVNNFGHVKNEIDNPCMSDKSDEQSTSTKSKPRRTNPLDIDGLDFDNEIYLRKLLKEKNLQELMDEEHSLTQAVRVLDSEMQNLVYENYNKFIAATDTIRSMKCDFARMEEEMKNLMTNMDSITVSSQSLSDELKEKRNQIQHLSKMNKTVGRLEFLFHLPKTMQDYIEKKDYTNAVSSYLSCKSILEQVSDMPALQSVYSETCAIVSKLKDDLKENFRSAFLSGKELLTRVELLLQLGEDQALLAENYLQSSVLCLKTELDEIQGRLVSFECENGTSSGNFQYPVGDILEFTDTVCSGFLGNVSLMVTSWYDMFGSVDDEHLLKSVSTLLMDYLSCMEKRLMMEKCTAEDGSSSLLIRALDRFYRRLLAFDQVLALGDTVRAEMLNIVVRVSKFQIDRSLQNMQAVWQKSVGECRKALTGAGALCPVLDQRRKDGQRAKDPLAKLLSELNHSVDTSCKSTLDSLLGMTASDLSFASASEIFIPTFRSALGDRLLVPLFQWIAESCERFCEPGRGASSASTTLLLILCKFCWEAAHSTVGELFASCERCLESKMEMNRGSVENRLGVQRNEIQNRLRTVAKSLLRHFVMHEGFIFSQMISKSVETRDWLGCIEPSSVRSVMKRIVEDLASVDARVGQLFEEGNRKEQSSDSSRRTSSVAVFSRNSRPWAPSRSSIGDSALSNTLGKLWNERIDCFSEVEFTKVSIMTGLVKICLKTLLETVRLCTFGKYGLQQVQVDCHYLQLYLWRFVSDENVVFTLLDEIVSSAVQRCVEPHLMEPNSVNALCEKP